MHYSKSRTMMQLLQAMFSSISFIREFKIPIHITLLILKGGAVGPGMFFVIPCTDEIRVMDLRTVSFDVPPQEILTKDSVTVSVDAVVYYNIRLIWNQDS